MAAARSPGSTISASCMSARNRPARCRAPPPMAAAAPRPRPPTPISGSAASTATISAAARSTPTWTSAEAAIKAVGEKLGVDADEAARGIIRIANNNMVNALKLVSLNRGHDPRDFTLVAFGGGGGMHGGRARRRARRQEGRGAGRRVGVLGLGHDDVGPAPRLFRHAPRRPQERVRRPASRRCSPRARSAGHARSSRPKASSARKVKFLRYGKFRYQNQEHTTEVLIEDGEVTDARLAEIEAAFHETYEREYTYRLDAPVEMVGIHLVASAEVGKLTMQQARGDRRRGRGRAQGPSRRRLCARGHPQGGDL